LREGRVELRDGDRGERVKEMIKGRKGVIHYIRRVEHHSLAWVQCGYYPSMRALLG